MFKEFKEFAITGNFLELASAVIIGGAVGKIITSLVDDVIMPIIGTVIGADFSSLATTVNGATIKYGIFVQNVFSFLLIALVLFMMIKGANKLKKKIIKIDITTKEIIETFDSLTAAAKSIGRTPACVSTDIIYQRPRDNFLFQYID